ncbi:MAG TPA: hypothetical protein VD963_00855 [Phycisphaerales bacterium]|nr:hypothetical protein [Phycisphaerales bacterium]
MRIDPAGLPPVSVPGVRPATRGTEPAEPRGGGGARDLVSAIVPGGVSFAPGASATAAPGGGPLPFYRHPADKNTAATAVLVGQSLDVHG